ncbi:VanW family protein [Clostridium sp. MSJ-11]|uniref:VanW family protein n=1 Tax=Clostridium mobile TaxID=2841512 RepID=A0ABS6EDB6_9CLOT|nr:VanW family protein [Clostridium mobile]MBU5483132.1 VanW family protein [Clostridium mobile]
MKAGKTWWILITTLLIGAVALYGSFYLQVSKWDNKMYPNTLINGIDVSGKTKEEAKEILENHLKEIENINIRIKAGNKIYNLNLSDGKTNSLDSVLNNALAYSKDLNIYSKYKTIKNPNKREYDVLLNYKGNMDKIIEKINKDVSKAPVDAYIKSISSGKPVISKDIPGEKLDKEDLINKINSTLKENTKDSEIIAKIKQYEANITEKKLQQIDSLISSFSTNLGGSPPGRVKNIHLGTSFINGTLLMPENSFSFNDKVGKISVERGFVEAPVIIKNRLEKGIGGGICQVSTTLYNAITTSNIKPIERKNHSIPPAYIDPGFDATVSENSIDYKFKNTLPYPLYIEGIANEEKITFNIYSNSSLNKVKYKLINEIYDKTEPKTIYEDDPTLPKGTVKKVQSAKPGCKVNVYLIGHKDGKEVSKELISKDIYKPSDEVIKRGTK